MIGAGKGRSWEYVERREQGVEDRYVVPAGAGGREAGNRNPSKASINVVGYLVREHDHEGLVSKNTPLALVFALPLLVVGNR